MIKIAKKTLLKESVDYDEPTKNVVNLTEEQMNEFGIKSCQYTGKCNCNCKNKNK